MKRRQFVGYSAASVLFLANFDLAHAVSSKLREDAIHEPTEIAWILAALSQIGREGSGVIRRDTDYFARVQRWFAPHATHRLVTDLGSEFNLPRLVGNAANYDFTKTGKLKLAPNSVALWDDAAGDLFTRNKEQIEAFAKVTNARFFLKREKKTFSSSHSALRAAVNIEDIQHWLNKQFSSQPRAVRVFVSPLTSGWNWANINGEEPRIWVPTPHANAENDIVAKFQTIASVFTEVDHIYVNPVTKIYMDDIELIFNRANDWANDSAWENYESAELVFNEYMTYALFMEYAKDRMNLEEFNVLKTKMVGFMEKKRGFIKFGLFTDMVNATRIASKGVVQEIYPKIIKNSASLSNRGPT
jgi:hypothetical protein